MSSSIGRLFWKGNFSKKMSFVLCFPWLGNSFHFVDELREFRATDRPVPLYGC